MFIPLFVANDVMGLLPVYAGLTDGMDALARRRVVDVARCITVAAVLPDTIA